MLLDLIINMMSLTTILLIISTLTLTSTKTPPIYNYSYYASFDETNFDKGVAYTVRAQQFYDPLANRQRIDYADGRYDRICGTVIPGAITPCQHIVTANRRWIVFPDKYQCCFCCDSAHGCGILSPSWLQDADYLGEERIDGTMFDKWSKNGAGYNYLWVTQDNVNIPRKLDEGGKHIKNYQVQFFAKQTFPDSVFALPAYCDIARNCPLESLCGVFRGNLHQE